MTENLNIQIHLTKSSNTSTTKTSCKLVFLMNLVENCQIWKLPKLKVAKLESYQSWKWFLYFLLKIKLTVLMNWIESCQNWNLPSLKVTNYESWQSWKLTKLKVSSAFLAESC